MALIIKVEVSLEASAFLFRGWVWLALTMQITKAAEFKKNIGGVGAEVYTLTLIIILIMSG